MRGSVFATLRLTANMPRHGSRATAMPLILRHTLLFSRRHITLRLARRHAELR